MFHLQDIPLCEAASKRWYHLLFIFSSQSKEEYAASLLFALQSSFSEMGGCLAWYLIAPILQIAAGGFWMPGATLQANEESN